MFVFTAIAVGFLGSFHCVGMCGPIALALPATRGQNKIAGRLIYNSGRIFTYSMMGLTAGLLGHTLRLAGLEKSLSISFGLVILIIALLSFLPQRFILLNGFLSRLSSILKQFFKKFFKQKSLFSLFFIGTANGLLPCGFVYLALAAAASSGQASEGFIYMAMFGLGTLPMMLSISLASQFFGLRFNSFLKKATPYVAMAVSILLIYRGISFQENLCCHH